MFIPGVFIVSSFNASSNRKGAAVGPHQIADKLVLRSAVAVSGCGKTSRRQTSGAYAGWTLRVIFFQSILFQSILVRRRERISMNRKISSNPREAVGMVWARLGSREKRP
jgi:hypothetical protein